MNCSAFSSLCLAASLALPQMLFGQGQSYLSMKFRYRLLVPAGWNTSVSGSGVLTIFDYKPEELLPQGLFPDEGSEIRVVPFAGLEAFTKAKTLDEWVVFNLARNHTGVSSKRRADLSKGEDSPQGVVEVEADFERNVQDGGLQHELNYYFTLRGKMFRLMLIYWRDNPQASTLRSTCAAVLASIQAN
jgi:hypothetical protein